MTTADGQRRCPDGGVCHHSCVSAFCWRVDNAAPLAGVFENDGWPLKVIATKSARYHALCAEQERKIEQLKYEMRCAGLAQELFIANYLLPPAMPDDQVAAEAAAAAVRALIAAEAYVQAARGHKFGAAPDDITGAAQ